MLQDAGIDDYLASNSDDRGVVARLRIEGIERKKRRQMMPKRAWMPKYNDKGGPANYHDGLTTGLQRLQKLSAEERRDISKRLQRLLRD